MSLSKEHKLSEIVDKGCAIMLENYSAESFIYFFVYICHFTCRCRAKEQENFPFLLKKPKFAAESELKALVAGKFQKSAVKRCVFIVFYLVLCNAISVLI